MTLNVSLSACILTNAFITGMQQLSERCSGSFSFDCLCSFLVLSQFTQHTGSHTLDILHWRIQQLEVVKRERSDVDKYTYMQLMC